MENDNKPFFTEEDYARFEVIKERLNNWPEWKKEASVVLGLKIEWENIDGK